MVVNYIKKFNAPVWWNGRHKGLKIPRWQQRTGSSPVTGTKIGSTPWGAANFGAGNCLTQPRPGDGGASRLVPVGDSSPRIVALGFNLVSVCSQNRPTLPQSAAPLGVLPILVLVVVRLGRAPATAASAA